MDQYVTGSAIRQLREKKKLTQEALAEKLGVSGKAVSRWETGKGYPDISLLGPLAENLSVSVAELLSGNAVVNANVSANMLRSEFYVCPVCGNVLCSTGECAVSCHGVSLLPAEAEGPDDAHRVSVEVVEDEYFVTVCHPMTRDHYISFIAGIGSDRVQLVKLYPEGNAEARIKINGVRRICYYCNRDGLFSFSPLNSSLRSVRQVSASCQVTGRP